MTTKPDKDDRAQALNWYLRKLLLHEQEKGVRPAFIARSSGLTKAQISHIMTDARSAGITAVLRLAPYFRRTEGELFDESLRWWERQGRREAADERLRQAQERKDKVDAVVKKRPSGERPSVRLRAGLPVDAAGTKKK